MAPLGYDEVIENVNSHHLAHVFELSVLSIREKHLKFPFLKTTELLAVVIRNSAPERKDSPHRISSWENRLAISRAAFISVTLA